MDQKITTQILQETKEIYNAIAPDFSDTRSIWWQGYGDFVKYAKDGDKILDLGCGNGRMAGIFKELKVDYLGLDNSEELLKIARERFEAKPNFKFEFGDLSDLNLENNKYDLILLFASLHHIPSKELRERVIRQAYASLKPGGRVIMSNWNLWQMTDNYKYWKQLLNYRLKIKKGVYGLSDAFMPWKKTKGLAEAPRYVHSFKLSEIRKLMVKAGFKIELLQYEYKGKRVGILKGGNSLVVGRKGID